MLDIGTIIDKLINFMADLGLDTEEMKDVALSLKERLETF